MKKFLLTILCLGNIAVYAQQYYQTAKIVDMPENQRRSMRKVGYGVGLSSTHVLAGSQGAPLQQLVFGDARVSPAYFATLGINGNIGNIAKFDWNRPNDANGTGFGQSVALSDDYAVVGEPFDFNEATQQPGDSYGAISVYEKSSGWVLKQKLIASSQVKYDNFGYEVKLAGNQILVGLNPSRSSSGDGKVYVFERNGAGTWEQVQLLTPTAAQQPFGRKNFGARISVSGDFMVVHSQPRIFVYQRVAGVWSVYQVFEPNHGNDGVYSSYGGVAISGDYIAISETEAMRDKNGQNIVSGAGAVFIYEKNNATQQWVFTQKIVSPERLAHAYQFFGSAVAMEGSKLVIGARGVKTDAANENYHDKLDGAVYVFERNGDGNWVQLQKIVSNDRGIGSVGAEFGSAVAIKDNKIAVGAYNNCTDLQGIEAMNSYMMGATYVFTSFQQGALPSSTASSSGVMGKVNNLLLMSENKEPIVTLGISGAQNLFKNYTTAKVWKQATEQTSEGKLYLSRNYQITPTTNAATSTGTVTLYFNQQEFLDFNANPAKTADFPTNPTDLQGIANLRILKISGSSSDNSGLINTYSGTQLVINPDDDKIVWNATANRWEVTFDVVGFSGFFAMTEPSVLPVNLVDFKANKESNYAKLQWQTTNEVNNKQFTVYRGGDDGVYVKIGEVAGSGANNGLNYYSFTDKQPLNGNNYYKLVQVDRDGKTEELGVRIVAFNFTPYSLNLYPNPTTAKVTVAFEAGKYQRLVLSSVDGKILQQLPLNKQETNKQISFSNYAPGIYFVKLLGVKTAVLKVVKQ